MISMCKENFYICRVIFIFVKRQGSLQKKGGKEESMLSSRGSVSFLKPAVRAQGRVMQVQGHSGTLSQEPLFENLTTLLLLPARLFVDD